MKELRPEYRRDDYYDFVVKDVGDAHAPYADRILMLGRGNHETSVLKNSNTDLIDRLAFYMNTTTGSHIMTGGYGGWIRFMFTHSGVTPDSSLKLKYFHGAGSEAPVTRGVIQTNRQAVYLPDADIVLNGHNHNNYYVPISRERISNKGTLFFDIQHHIRVPGYKSEYADGSGGWAVERGGIPKPNGAAWMRMFYDDHAPQVEFTMAIEGGMAGEPAGFGGDDREPLPEYYDE